jgi:hypothetical protein
MLGEAEMQITCYLDILLISGYFFFFPNYFLIFLFEKSLFSLC